ncbi:hypothetical protein SESBI_31475 [Sesbania bispinosa]|nr:hypothetical protein SESBI_31475 [Sesbania bispinosa]
MSSDDPMTFQFHSSLQDEDFENDTDDTCDHHHHHHHSHPHNLSRLSVCTSRSTVCDDDVEDDAMAMYMSGLSIEGDGDADGEFSDGKEFPASGLFSDSETDCYPLPATPPRRRNQTPLTVKEYASDNEGQRVQNKKAKEKKDPWKRRSRVRKDTFSEKNRKVEHMVEGLSGESDQNGSMGLRVLTRPKGGRRSLCMDLEEVKACKDLGFELELEIPSPLSISLSNSTLDTSSGATSPISNWRISSPGDDPRDVKARLKMWAQAVAASASKYGT